VAEPGRPPATRPPAELLATAAEVRAPVERLAGEIRASHGDDVLVVAVLKGTLLFVADLLRALGGSAQVDFLAVAPYVPGTGRVRLVKDLDVDLAGRQVVLVEDIVDTGLTLGYLLGELGRRGPSSLAVCTLLDRPARRILPVPIDHVGFEIPDRFVIGYGLDHAGWYRNLPFLATGDPEVLRVEPDAYAAQLYGSMGEGEQVGFG
jgi:hypoxanthine phosphoribosyltransferase